MGNSSRKKKRPNNKTVLIITNGKTTENTYLNAMKRQLDRQDVRVKVRFVNGEPDTVLKALRSPNGDVSAYDEIWIVVDEDGHDRRQFISDCKKLCRKGQKWVAIVSRPCFEVWLIAHYEKVRVYRDQEHAQRHFASLVPSGTPKKSIPVDFPYDQIDAAMTNCQLSDGSECVENELPSSPGTGMPVLVRSLRK